MWNNIPADGALSIREPNLNSGRDAQKIGEQTRLPMTPTEENFPITPFEDALLADIAEEEEGEMTEALTAAQIDYMINELAEEGIDEDMLENDDLLGDELASDAEQIDAISQLSPIVLQEPSPMKVDEDVARELTKKKTTLKVTRGQRKKQAASPDTKVNRASRKMQSLRLKTSPKKKTIMGKLPKPLASSTIPRHEVLPSALSKNSSTVSGLVVSQKPPSVCELDRVGLLRLGRARLTTGRKRVQRSQRVQEEPEVLVADTMDVPEGNGNPLGNGLGRARQTRPIGQGDAPNRHQQRQGIVPPPVQNHNFEIKLGMINLVQNKMFHGLPSEDPIDHLDEFDRLCDLTKINGVSEDAIKLRLFPMSLADKAHQWEKSLPHGTITTWDECKKAFLAKFFSTGRTAKLRGEISSFIQRNNETFAEAWERFKGYTSQCPHHGFNNESLLSTLYRGCLPRMLWRDYESTDWSSTAHSIELDAQMRKDMLALNSKLDKLILAQFPAKHVNYVSEQTLVKDQEGEETTQEVCYIQNRQGSYRNPQQGIQQLSSPLAAPTTKCSTRFQPKDYSYPTNSRLGYEGNAPTTFTRASQRVCPSSYTKKWEAIPSRGSPPQIAVDIDDEEGEDLVDYADNSTPNSIELEQNPEPELDRAGETETLQDKPELDRAQKRTDKANSSQPAKPVAKKKDTPAGPPPYKPPLPFPGRFKKQLLEAHKAKFDELMRQLELKLPFIDALMLIPPYQKFLKDAVQQRTREAQGMVVLTRECSAIIQRKVISDKKEDPGSFTLPCMLGPLSFKNSLCDLGSSVSLMPLSVAKRLGYHKYQACGISLVLADRSIRLPTGMLEDLPLRIGNVEIPTDFIVLEMDEEPTDPLILGRPFLATARAMIDVCEGTIELNLGKDLKDEV
ncbi:unnamed protein product [Microthlaspi erraticum]|uniref:Retrotransposon gag domain-containing protein n=1 Tax=Microthlaspi erraticum TaxID=1685480 RepID=A0A6D2JAW9_9BRAS|nr:unnamed protein product [Microthlaspi erraticum]